jgi:hypothetical protein
LAAGELNRMNAGEKLLHDAAVRGLLQAGDFLSLREVFEAGLQSSMSTLAQRREAILNHLLKDRETMIMLGLPTSAPPSGLAAKLGVRHAEDAASRAQTVVAASELVFSHSVTDQVASDCCQAVTLLRPLSCVPDVQEEKVTLDRVRQFNFDVLLAEALKRHHSRLTRKSLPNRIEWLHRICPPLSQLEDLPGYKYDGARIERLDTCRHSIVHDAGVRAALKVTTDDISYMQQTAVYLPRYVMASLGIPLDTSYTAGKWKSDQEWPHQ